MQADGRWCLQIAPCVGFRGSQAASATAGEDARVVVMQLGGMHILDISISRERTSEAVMMAVPTIPLNCQRMLHGHRALLWHGQKVGDICDDSTVIFTLVADCLSLQEFLTRARVHYHYLDDAYSDYETTWTCIHYSQRP